MVASISNSSWLKGEDGRKVEEHGVSHDPQGRKYRGLRSTLASVWPPLPHPSKILLSAPGGGNHHLAPET